MSDVISKELITQVLRMYPQYSQDDVCSGNIQYKSGLNVVHFEVNERSMQQINTYELAHKSKEYIFNEGMWIRIVYRADKYIYIEIGITDQYHNYYECMVENEIDGIFKCAQFILDNKDKQ